MAVLVGHSFIRRLRDDILANPHQKRRIRDITWTHPYRARVLAEGLNISDFITSVYTESDNLNFIGDLDRSYTSICHVDPMVVVIDIGSNDIAQCFSGDPWAMLALATQVHDFATSIQKGALHPLIIINAVIPRINNMQCDPQTFRINAMQYNKCLGVLCDTKDGIVINKMRGFNFTNTDRQEQPREVISWSNDGIHPDMPGSMERYRNRVRHCILDNLHRCIFPCQHMGC
jgi:hypothetical protein